MKQLLNIFVLLLLANIAMAQAPQGIPYQAVARNSSGAILASTAISVRFTIRDSIATGTIKYRETFSVTTSAQGMFSVNVGQGTPITGTFSVINWGANSKFLQVELDPSGGSSYIDMGTTQMMSVPYALYAANSGGSGPWQDSAGNIFNTNVTSRVGIGTHFPRANLHVNNSDAIFTGKSWGDFWSDFSSGTVGDPAVSGSGSRMMWYMDKAAIRGGIVSGTNWDKDSIGIGSLGIGLDGIASGQFSMTVGMACAARATNAVAMGNHCQANGAASFAMGYQCTSNAAGSVSFGETSVASGVNSFACGSSANAQGGGSVALGINSLATGHGSVALGNFTMASGFASTAIGNGTISSGNESTALGYLSNASQHCSVAMGISTLSSGVASLSTGCQTIASGNNSLAAGFFSVSSGAESFALGTYVSTNEKLGSFAFGDASTMYTTEGYLMNSLENQMSMRFTGGYKLFTSSDLSTGAYMNAGDNSWSTISDRRKKENFAAIDGEAFLRKISKFNLTSWNYKGQDPKVHRHYGPMAQDFYAAFGEDEYGTVGNDTTINQADMEGVSFTAIQALVKRTEELQKEIAQLKNENHGLKAELSSRDAQINDRLSELERKIRLGETATK